MRATPPAGTGGPLVGRQGEQNRSAEPGAPQQAVAQRRPTAIAPQRDESAERPLPESLGFLADVPLQVEIRLGATKLSIGELLELAAGSIVVLDRRADEPVEVVAAGQVIARGEVVVVDNCLGVRITELCGGGGEAQR